MQCFASSNPTQFLSLKTECFGIVVPPTAAPFRTLTALDVALPCTVKSLHRIFWQVAVLGRAECIVNPPSLSLFMDK